MRKIKQFTASKIRSIEQSTVDLWLILGTIKITEYGEENTYYIDQFNNEFYCKNYPQNHFELNSIDALADSRALAHESLTNQD
jgi:hypothetical protein